MIIVGVVLILVVVVGSVIVAETGGDPVHLDVHWFTIRADGTALFISGAAALLLLVLGFWFLRHGLRRARNRRREMRELRERAAADRPSSPPRPTATPPKPETPTPRRSSDADDHFDTAPRD